MGFIAAGLAVAAVGAGASAYGSSKNASASRKAAKEGAAMENVFAQEQQALLGSLIKEKEDKLDDINTTLDRFGGGPTAQTQENLDLLRKTQNDFLRMGAGDFEAFEGQLADIMSATVANSFGAGSPAGTFTQLSAQNIASLRQQGVSTGTQIGGVLANDTNNLLSMEFGLMDQEFNTQRDIEGRRIGQITGYRQQAAETAGANWQAGGSFLQTVGSALTTYGTGVNSGAIGGSGGSNFDPAGTRVASDRPYYSAPAPQLSYSAPAVATYQPLNLNLPDPSSGGGYYTGGVLPSIGGGGYAVGPTGTGYSNRVPSPVPVTPGNNPDFFTAYLDHKNTGRDPFSGLATN